MGKKKSKSKTKSEPWKPVQQPIINAVNTASGIVSGNQDNLESIAGDVRGFLPQLGQMAFGPQAGVGAAQGYATDVMGGKYLGQGNPHMNQMLSQTRENVGNQYNSTFSLAGRTGSMNHREGLAEGLGKAENQMRYQDYGAERDRMAQMASLIPGLTQAQYAGIQPYLAAAQTAGQLPYAGVGALSPIIGLAGGSGTTTGTQPGGWGNGLLGAGATLGSAIISKSDVNAKENIELVGLLENGLGLYEWNYKQDVGIEGRFRGVMAQEVAKVMPWMLGPKVDGYMTVRYTPERIG